MLETVFNALITRKKTVVGAVLALIVLLSCFSIINEGERGLRFTLGKISNTEIVPGIAFTVPFIQSVKTYSIRPIKTEVDIEVGSTGAITKDNQTVGAKLAVYYQYKKGQLVEMYSNTGEDKIERMLGDTLLGSFKSVLGTYDIFNVAGARQKIAADTLVGLKAGMASYPIEITKLEITNYDWSDEFDKQIATTMKRAQEVKQKQQELLIAEQEAQKQVKRAEAEKTSLITKAQGEREAAKLRADAKKAEGQGIRDYNASLRSGIDIELKLRQLEIDKIRAQKWDGKLVPTNNYGPIPVQTGRIQGN